MSSWRSALVLAVVVSRVGFAQARVVSEPPEPSLLNITRQWSRASSLGDLREARAGSGYLELRVWGGFGLGMRTQGVVLRRAAGRWSAYVAQVMRCEIQLPTAVGDTASRATMERYTAEARRQCGTPLTDVGPGAYIVTAESLLVDRLSVPDSAVERAWAAAARAGAFQLPARVERGRAIDDAFMYVVELRSGGDYRASVIEHVEPPETEADRRVRDVYAAVSRILPPELLLTAARARATPGWPSDSAAVHAAARRFLTAFENLDWEPFAASFADDATAFFPAPEPPESVVGKAAVLARFRLVFDAIRRGSGRTEPPYHRLAPVNLAIAPLGPGAAVVTFELVNAERHGRRTVVFTRGDGDSSVWRISHLHASNATRSER